MFKELGFSSKIWLGVFALWMVFLSGVLAPLTGTPGIIQMFKLRMMLTNHQEQLAQLEKRGLKFEEERKLLEVSPAAQEREIRRVLGYVAPNELVFDLRPTKKVR